MRTKQRNNLAETARHERVAQNTDVYAVKARNYKGLRRGSPVFKDGLKYCKVCGEPKEAYFPAGGFMGMKKHSRQCACDRKEYEEK